jgi:nitrate reductase NapE component
MDYLAIQLFPWLLVAFVGGLLMGWFSYGRSPDR